MIGQIEALSVAFLEVKAEKEARGEVDSYTNRDILEILELTIGAQLQIYMNIVGNQNRP